MLPPLFVHLFNNPAAMSAFVSQRDQQTSLTSVQTQSKSKIQKNQKKTLWLVLVLLVMYGCFESTAVAQSSADIRFAQSGIRCVRSSESVLELEYTPRLLGWDTVARSNSRVFVVPKIYGARVVPPEQQMAHRTAGSPSIIEIRVPIAVPSPSGFRLDNVVAHSVQRVRTTIAPLPTLVPGIVTVTEATVVGAVHHTDSYTQSHSQSMRQQARSERVPTATYIINEEAYATAPTADWCSLEYAGIGRNRHVAYVILRPARYDAASQTIELPKRLSVTVRFEPSSSAPLSTPSPTSQHSGEKEQNSYHSLEYSPLFNYAQSRSWTVAPTAAPDHTPTQQQALQTSLASNATTSNAASKGTSDVSRAEQAGIQSSSGRWYVVAVSEEGMYRIDAQQLRDARITIAPQEIATIRMFGNGGMPLSTLVSEGLKNHLNEQAILVDSAGGQVNSITFYGAAPDGWIYDNGQIRHFINPFTYVNTTRRVNYYLLNVGGSVRGRRVSFVDGSDLQATLRPTTHTGRIFWEEEDINPYNSGSGLRWYGALLTSPWTRPTRLTNLMQGGTVSYRYSAGYFSPNGVLRGGRIVVRESGREIDSFNLLPTGFYEVAYMQTRSTSLAASALSSGMSSLQFSIEGNSPGNDGVVDWLEIAYPRSFTAIDNKLDFFTELPQILAPTAEVVVEYTVSNFASSSTQPVFIVDATERMNPVFYRNLANVGGQAYFKARVTPDTPRRFFLSSQLLRPTSIAAAEFADVRSERAGADIILITHKDLLSSAQAYKSYRERQSGMSVFLVTTEHLYNEYGGGMPDPTTLRDFIAQAYRDWQRKPRYVVLWGDGHFDYRNIRARETNYVPTYQIYDADGIISEVNTNYMTEDYFVCVVGNDPIVDIPIGRLTARINARGEDEGMVMLSKIRQYETASSNDLWRTRMTFVADDAGTSYGSDGALHTADSEQLILRDVPQDMRAQRIYLPDYPAEVDITSRTGGVKRPMASQEIINSINSGTLVLNWIGHGAPSLWAHEQVFLNDQIPLLTNLDKLFFLTAATCDYSRFDMINFQCGPELMLSSPRGGAIGIFGATRTVYADRNAIINQDFYSTLFARQPDGRTLPVGDVLHSVKQTLYGQNDVKYCLLGDPTIRLHIPQQQATIQDLGGSYIAGGAERPLLKALQTVPVTGDVRVLSQNPSLSQTDNTFNGNAILLLYDTDIQRRPVDVDVFRTEHNFMSLGGLLSVGTAQVRNGQFSTTIVIPKDISFSNLAGRLFVYAFDTTQRKYARGITTSFRIGGVDETAVNDGKGPDITISLENRRFRAGDFVSQNPLLIVDLSDKTGLNATGSGIGHDIQCWVDNALLPITLTPFFTPSLDDARRGTVQRQLFGLTPGIRRIRIRAWDVFNNYSEAETWFRVAGDGMSAFVTELTNYPNPFDAETTIQFRHNIPALVPVNLQIYTLTGLLVRTITLSTESRTTEVVWDGRNDKGIPLPTGLYLYRVNLVDTQGNVVSATNKMLLIR
jgi:hypothetical protein